MLIAIAAGILVGHFWFDTGAGLKPLGDAFLEAVAVFRMVAILCCARP